MMRIAWITNVEVPVVSDVLHNTRSAIGGWLDFISRGLIKDMYIHFLFHANESIKGEGNQFSFESFTDATCDNVFQSTFATNSFDLVHLFGTEGKHIKSLLSALKKYRLQDFLVISIQGMAFPSSYHWLPMIPYRYVKRRGIREIYLHTNLLAEQRETTRRGTIEKEIIRYAKYCEGRTFWDKAVTNLINPDITYYQCNEALRDEFYEGRTWDIHSIHRHSLFVSQSYYSIKGFHFLLEAMPMILQRFPDTKIVTTGSNVMVHSFKEYLKLSSYKLFLRSLIQKYGLQESVSFVGLLNARQMKEQYLQAHVFVSASSIENSPNSVCEAMISGCPVVSSNVGGVASLLRHGEEGFLYQYDAPYLLAYYIISLFEDDELACDFSRKARQRALVTHDRSAILSTQRTIYENILARRGGTNTE